MTTPLAFARIFPEFRAPSWAGWRAVLAKLTPSIREFYAICGRGAGKSRIVALLACCFASRKYKHAPGERIFVGVFAPDRKQSRVTFRYVVGLLHSVPELAALIENETAESLDLSNGVTIEVITASRAAPRGRSYALAIVEEAAFLSQEGSANPDTDLLTALRPALARVPGSLLAVVSSPYARRGVLWNAWRRHHDQSDVLLVQAPTLELNPTFDKGAIARATEEDPVAAAAEYDAQFRTDIESYVPREVVESCLVPGRHEQSPVAGVRYHAFVDPSGGGADSMTLAIGHRDGEVAVLDAVRERRPPFSPEAVVREYAELLRSYGISSVTGDRYAGEWPREQFRKHGVAYTLADRTKSDLYRDALPLLNSAQVELLDLPRLVAQLVGLERRTARGGRDSIDHAPGAHDDVANAVCGVIVLASAATQKPKGGLLFVGRRMDGTDSGHIYGLEGDALALSAALGYRAAGYGPDGRRVEFALRDAAGRYLRDPWTDAVVRKRREDLTSDEARALQLAGTLTPDDVASLTARGALP